MTPGGRYSSSPSSRPRSRSPGSGSVAVCVDCVVELVATARPAPYPGPRCWTHHKRALRTRSERRKARHVETTYSITEGQYTALLAAQAGKCAICQRVRSTNRKRLAVDHDHSCCSGKTSCGKCVRGLLCTKCNKYLGHIRDSPEAMERGQKYLLNPPARAVLGL